MPDLRPLGSEKLPLEQLTKRIMEIARYKDTPNSQKPYSTTSSVHFLKEANNGLYAVVREKDGYYVKQGINEASLDYIGGMRMKNKNRFSSYAEALKRLELIAQPLTEQDKKYVLKSTKPPVTEDPAGAPSMDTPPAADAGDAGDAGGDELEAGDAGEGGAPPAMDAAPAPEAGEEDATAPTATGEEGELPMHLKAIQKITGKLGQKLRAYKDELKGDDYKYVINSILSAIDMTKLQDEDKDEIAARFDTDSDYDKSGSLDAVDDDSDFGNLGDEGNADTDADTDQAVPPAKDAAPAPEAGEGDEELGEENHALGFEDFGYKDEDSDEFHSSDDDDYDDIFENFKKLERILKG